MLRRMVAPCDLERRLSSSKPERMTATGALLDPLPTLSNPAAATADPTATAAARPLLASFAAASNAALSLRDSTTGEAGKNDAASWSEEDEGAGDCMPCCCCCCWYELADEACWGGKGRDEETGIGEEKSKGGRFSCTEAAPAASGSFLSAFATGSCRELLMGEGGAW